MISLVDFQLEASRPPRSGPRSHILAVLKANQWEMETTARALGIHRSSLFRKMKRLGIEKPETRI